MRNDSLDSILKEASARVVNDITRDIERADGAVRAEVKDAGKSKILTRSSGRKYKKQLTVILLSAVLFAMLSTTCLAIPSVRDHVSELFTLQSEERSPEQIAKEMRFICEYGEYTLDDLLAIDEVLLNRIAGAGGDLYAFLDDIASLDKQADTATVKQRLVPPYTCDEVYGDGIYRSRLCDASGVFLSIDGAKELYDSFNSENTTLDKDLPFIYHLIVASGISKADFIKLNEQEKASVFGYPFTSRETEVLFSLDTERTKNELSSDTAFFHNGALYSIKELTELSDHELSSLLELGSFHTHVCRLARTYSLDGSDLGNLIDRLTERVVDLQLKIEN